MKIGTSAKLQVLAKTTGEYNNKPTYKIAVIQECECGTVSCTKDLYDAVQIGKTYNIEMVYNDQYKSAQFTRVLSEAGANK